jgi:hypothetical protein
MTADAVYFLSWPGSPVVKRISAVQAQGLWDRQIPPSALCKAPGKPAEITILAALRKDLNVASLYACRLKVKDGRVDEADVCRVCRVTFDLADATLDAAIRAGRNEQKSLPKDAPKQLAVCLDEPAWKFKDAQPGGPLALARIGRMPLAEVVRSLGED